MMMKTTKTRTTKHLRGGLGDNRPLNNAPPKPDQEPLKAWEDDPQRLHKLPDRRLPAEERERRAAAWYANRLKTKGY
jgi:hypothetical protein